MSRRAPPSMRRAPPSMSCSSNSSGRRRISMAKIESLRARRVCFSKRRQSLFRKCKEFADLFPDCEIAAVAFSPDVGNPFVFASNSASPAEIFSDFLANVASARPTDKKRFTDDVGVPFAPSTSNVVKRSTPNDVERPSGIAVDGRPSPSVRDEELVRALLDEDDGVDLAVALQWASGVFDGDGGAGALSPDNSHSSSGANY